MAQQMTRYELTPTDQIRLVKTGEESVLHIADKVFVLPKDKTSFEKVKSQFRQAWNELDSIDPSNYSG